MTGHHTSSTVRRRYRERLWGQQGGCCFYCKTEMRIATGAGAQDPDTATFDHVIPICKGGIKGISNVVLACLRCNQAKGGKVPRARKAV